MIFNVSGHRSGLYKDATFVAGIQYCNIFCFILLMASKIIKNKCHPACIKTIIIMKISGLTSQQTTGIAGEASDEVSIVEQRSRILSIISKLLITFQSETFLFPEKLLYNDYC